MLSLIVNTGKHKGKKIVLPDKEVIIGRDEKSFIRMTSNEVSRQHCSLTPTERGLLVRDLGSQNGTLVNSVKIEGEALLHPGDKLQIGPIHFELEGSQPDKSGESTDDDIFGWLSERDTATDLPPSGDTTIVKGGIPGTTPAANPAATNPSLPLAPASTPPVPEQRPKFRTIGEEARDIIRRHMEALEET
ncbi:MAG: FHA domain-containing protein [Planctomycetes bacterium]|nr:FHA domain-containing protein [Planctomycetota bacterium]